MWGGVVEVLTSLYISWLGAFSCDGRQKLGGSMVRGGRGHLGVMRTLGGGGGSSGTKTRRQRPKSAPVRAVWCGGSCAAGLAESVVASSGDCCSSLARTSC